MFINFDGTTITQRTELYQYRFYLETLLTCGSDAVTSHLKNAYSYLDIGDLTCDPTKADTTNKWFISRWDRIKKCEEMKLLGRLHSDICNVILYLLPGVKLDKTR
jgi:hypothetical protein